MKSRPATTVGGAQATEASGNPNAHCNASLGICAAVRPAAAAAWNRVLVSDGLHPAQDASFVVLRPSSFVPANEPASAQIPTLAPFTSPSSVRPVIKVATA